LLIFDQKAQDRSLGYASTGNANDLWLNAFQFNTAAVPWLDGGRSSYNGESHTVFYVVLQLGKFYAI